MMVRSLAWVLLLLYVSWTEPLYSDDNYATEVTFSPDSTVSQGDNVTVKCSFRLNTTRYPKTSVGLTRRTHIPRSPKLSNLVYSNKKRTVTAYLHNVTRLDSGSYWCFTKPTIPGNKIHSLKTATLLVAEPVNITNVTMRCYTQLTVFNCSWDVPKFGVKTHWRVKIGERTGGECDLNDYGVDSQTKNGVHNSCEWYDQKFPYNTILVVLTAYHDFYNDSKVFTFPSHRIELPHPMTNLRVTNKSSTSVTLDWVYTGFPTSRNVTSNITASSRWGVKHYHRTFPFPDTGVSRTDFSEVITPLIPATKYTFSVRVQVANGLYWSPPTHTTATTYGAVPGASPFLSPNSFTQHMVDLGGGDRNVSVYWMDLPPTKRHGDIMYVVNVSTAGEPTTSHTTPTPYIVLGLSTHVRYTVTVQARNQMGLGADASIVIPEASKISADLISDVTAELFNSTHVIVTWVSPNSQQSHDVTIHYCHGIVTRPDLYTAECRDNYQLETLPDYTGSSYTLKDPALETGYVFGVSMDTATNNGVRWASCLHKHNGVAGKTTSLKVTSVTDARIVVAWEAMDCATAQGAVLYYRIVYSVGPNCHDGNVTRIPAGELTYSVTGLESRTNYSICLMGVTRWGEGLWSDPTYQMTNRTVLSVGAVAGIIVGVVAVVFVICCLFCYSRRKPPKVPIDLPPPVDNNVYMDVYPQPDEYDEPPLTDPLVANLHNHKKELQMDDLKGLIVDGLPTDSGNDTLSLASTNSKYHHLNGSRIPRDIRDDIPDDCSSKSYTTANAFISDASDKSNPLLVKYESPRGNAPTDEWNFPQNNHTIPPQKGDKYPLPEKRDKMGEYIQADTVINSIKPDIGSKPLPNNSALGSGDGTMAPVSPYSMFSSDYTPVPITYSVSEPATSSGTEEKNPPMISGYITVENALQM